MKRATSIACVAAAGAVLGLAAPASATTFCVPNFHAGCPNDGTNVAEANVEAAMGTNGSDGVADTVILAAGTVTNPDSIVPVGSDPLTVRGAGADATILTTTDNTNGLVVDLWGVGVNTRSVTMRDLEIAVPASMPANEGGALQMSNDLLEDARIVSRNPGDPGVGSSGVSGFVGGGTIRRTTFDEEAGGRMGRAFDSAPADSGPILLEDVSFDSPVSALTMSDPGGTVVARRLRIATPEQITVGVSAGTVILENAIIYASITAGLSVGVNSDADGTLTADHVTAVNVGALSNVASVASNVNGAGSDGDANVTVTNSIFRGFDTGVQRQVSPGATGPANATVLFSNIDPDVSEVAGLGTVTAANNIDADPDFISLLDLRLEPGSPSIDAGDPAAGGLTSDIDGAARPQDGDDNGSTIRDQGAYEVPDPTPPGPGPPGGDTTPPETAIEGGPGKRKLLRKRRTTFSFSSNEAGSTFECRLDSKPFAACESPLSQRKLKRGKRRFEVRAIDAAGNVDPTPAPKRFKVPKKKKRGR